MQSIPYGTADGRNAMGIPVAFCSAIGLDISELRRLIWVSGQLAYNEQNQLVGTGDVRAQTEQCLENIERNLRALGGSIDDVVQVTVFVKDMSHLEAIHEVRLRHFSTPYPTSTLVAVSGFVNPEALIEINAVAAVRST
ncbi:MAG TPA: RidA family protein [Chloroflexota bacterium]|jgi:enamine deaminase RidA (YjgF/YER057c/UK114 family)